jgi:hypothetical protein
LLAVAEYQVYSFSEQESAEGITPGEHGGHETEYSRLF